MTFKTAFVACTVACFTVAAHAATTYRLIDLGYSSSCPELSENGTVAYITSAPGGGNKVMRYTVADGQFQELDIAASSLGGVNDKGVIAGSTPYLTGQLHGRVFASNGIRTRLWTGGGDGTGFVHAINNAGQIVGASYVSADTLFTHAYLLNGKEVVDLNSMLGGGYSIAVAISRNGIVGGLYEALDPVTGGQERAFIYQNGVMHDVGSSAPEINTNIIAVNNAGIAVGTGHIWDGNSTFAMIFRIGEEPRRLLPDEVLPNTAVGINNHGHIIGNRGYGSNRQPFIYKDGKLASVKSLLDPVSGDRWDLAEVCAINDNGQIAGVAFKPELGEHRVLLTPVTPTSSVRKHN